MKCLSHFALTPVWLAPWPTITLSVACFGLLLGAGAASARAQAPSSQTGPGSAKDEEKGNAHAKPQQKRETIEVVVDTGTRREVHLEESPIRTQVLSGDALQDAASPTIEGAILGLQGLELDADPHGGAPTMHGLEPEHLLILRDGQRLTGRSAGRIDLGRLYALRYERVEWVAGRASSLYGSDAIAGVMNLKTRWPKQGWEPRIRVAMGNYLYLSGFAGLGWTKGKWAAMLSAGGQRRRAYDLTPDTPSTSGDAIREGDLEGGVRWTPSSRFEFSLLGGVGDQTFQGIDQNAAGAVLLRSNRTWTPRADLRAKWRFSKGQLQGTLHYDGVLNRMRFDQRGDDALDRVDRTRDHVGSLELLHHHLVHERHWLSAGVQVQLERMRGKRIGEERKSRPRVSAFIQDEWSLGSNRQFTVVPSARLDWDKFFGLNFTPQIAAMWRYKDRLEVRASLGRGYRAPSFKDLFMVFNNPSAGYRVRGNPDLKPETSWGANASVDLRITSDLRWNLQLFEQRLRGLITPIAGREPQFDGLTFRYQNIGKASTRGAETGLSWIVDQESLRWDIDGGYRFMYTRNHAANRPLQGRAPHRVRLRSALEIKGWGLRLGAQFSLNLGQAYFVSSKGDAPAQKKVLDPQWRLRVTLSQKIYRNLSVFGRAENLLGAGDPDFAPLARRAFFGGLQWLHGQNN